MMIWFNGEIREEHDIRIDPRDRGFLLGDGLFETVLAREGHIAFADAHIRRLTAGSNVLGIPLVVPPAHLSAACKMVLEANDLHNSPRVALRITLTRGPGPRGLLPPKNPTPTLMISATESPTPVASQTALLTTPRRNALSPTSRLKALPYLDNLIAREEAHARGADEALMLDTSGHLACGSVANIFLWESNRLLTPSTECGILPGVTRAAVIALAKQQKINVSEEMIAPERLATCDGAFLTNSLMGLMPLSRLNARDLAPHRLTARLQAAYDLLLDADANDKNAEGGSSV
jgi:branched-chain amino acid aminotransferase